MIVQILVGALLMAPFPNDAAVTFNRDIAPLIHESCTSCHRPAQAAPFSLRTYNEVRKRARLLLSVMRRGTMPPWLPNPEAVAFEGERLVTDEQIELFSRWLEAGLPEGDERDQPKIPQFPEGWYHGPPDMIVEMPVAYTLSAGGPDVYRNFVLDVDLPETRYVEGVEFKPGTPSVVHHATMLVDRRGTARRLDEEEAEPGFSGMIVQTGEIPDGHFLGWTPGKTPKKSRSAWRIDGETDLILQLHLQPSGKEEQVRAKVGLYFAESPPKEVPLMLKLGSKVIDIPAEEKAYVIRDAYELPVDVTLHSVYPHAHYLATSMKSWATRPDGKVVTLLDIPSWDFNWQDDYRYRSPILLPHRSVIHLEYTYDNSASNVRNPNDPPVRVLFGPESTDEMCAQMFEAYAKNPVELQLLQRDLALKEHGVDVACAKSLLERDPHDAHSLSVLANDHAQRNELAEAIRYFELLTSLAPDEADHHSNLALALHRHGQGAKALESIDRAVALEPKEADWHFNRGLVLRRLQRSEEALRAFEKTLSLDPDHARALYRLANLHFLKGEVDEGRNDLGRAVEVDPGFVPARLTLARDFLRRGEENRAKQTLVDGIVLSPVDADLHGDLALLHERQGNPRAALDSLEIAVRLGAPNPELLTRCSWWLATADDAQVRNGQRALEMAQRACRLSRFRHPGAILSLGAALAEIGRYEEAEQTLERLKALPETSPWYSRFEESRRRYSQAQPMRTPFPSR